MYLGLRDLRVAKGRFALVGVVIVLVALLSTVLAGLANGLVDDGISGLRALPISHLSFQEGAESSFSRSILATDQLATFDEAPGVEATPIGVSFLNAATDDGKTIDIALFGVDPGGFLAEASAAGDGTTAAAGGGIEDGLVLAEDLADEVEIGERFTIAGRI